MSRSFGFVAFAGWLALVASVSADIVWSGNMYQRTYHEVPAIDFNLDGTNDFTFSETVTNHPLATIIKTWIEPENGRVVNDNLFVLENPSGRPLSAGATIGANLESSDYVWGGERENTFLFSISHTDAQFPSHGGFFDEGYLGVSFNTGDGLHYGWIELSHDKTRPFPEREWLMVHGWAWETADTPIIAGAIPEPSSGILTMVGSLALLQLARSRRRKQTNPPLPTSRPQIFKAPEKW